MSDTPRTDAAEHQATETPWNCWVSAAIAQNLERELAQAGKIPHARLLEIEADLAQAKTDAKAWQLVAKGKEAAYVAMETAGEALAVAVRERLDAMEQGKDLRAALAHWEALSKPYAQWEALKK